MALTPEQQAFREYKMTASFLPYLMAGDVERMVSEFQRLVGDPAYVEVDLSNAWPPSFGSYVEPFAIDWHQKKTGFELIDRGKWVDHPELDFIGSTIDCRRPVPDNRVIDCKAPMRWTKLEKVLDFYPSQLVIQKACVKAASAALLVVHGGDEPVEHEITWDDAYENEVWSRVNWFWQRVTSLQPPCAIPAAKAPIPAIRQVDMSSSNTWCAFAETYFATQDAAKAHADAKTGMKELIEPDVARAFGHGIIASRSKTGAITFKKEAR